MLQLTALILMDIIKSSLISIAIVSFIIFAFWSIGVEINEYPHKTITLKGNTVEKYDYLTICSEWNETNPTIKVDYIIPGKSDIQCSESSLVWNPKQSNTEYYLSYEIIIRSVNQYDKLIEVEVTYLNSIAIIQYKGLKIL